MAEPKTLAGVRKGDVVVVGYKSSICCRETVVAAGPKWITTSSGRYRRDGGAHATAANEHIFTETELAARRRRDELVTALGKHGIELSYRKKLPTETLERVLAAVKTEVSGG